VAAVVQSRTYEPIGAAKDLFSCRASEVLMDGPAGTGKTRAILTKIHLCLSKYPGARALIFRKTRSSMTESVLVTYEAKVCPPECPWIAGAARATRKKYTYPNGSELVVGGMDNPDRIMSTEYDIVAGFEATELSADEWEKVMTRLRNGVMPYQQGLADCNPSYPSHWLNMRAETDRMVRLVSRHTDNPSVTPVYLDRLSRLTGPRRDRLFLGKWVAAEGIIYEGFDRAVHAIQSFPIPADWRKIRAIDFGFTNPFSCQWWALDGDGRMYLYREIYKTKRLVSDHAKRINELSAGETYDATISDHDAEDRETLHQAGIFTLAACKSVTPGIEAVANRMKVQEDGKPRLFVMLDTLDERDPELAEDGKPTSTLSEFDGYIWHPAKDGKAPKEEPVKVNDHGMDAMRYAVAYLDVLAPASAMLSTSRQETTKPVEKEEFVAAVASDEAEYRQRFLTGV